MLRPWDDQWPCDRESDAEQVSSVWDRRCCSGVNQGVLRCYSLVDGHRCGCDAGFGSAALAAAVHPRRRLRSAGPTAQPYRRRVGRIVPRFTSVRLHRRGVLTCGVTAGRTTRRMTGLPKRARRRVLLPIRTRADPSSFSVPAGRATSGQPTRQEQRVLSTSPQYAPSDQRGCCLAAWSATWIEASGPATVLGGSTVARTPQRQDCHAPAQQRSQRVQLAGRQLR